MSYNVVHQDRSWRLSPDLKSDLEREARRRKVPVSAVVETAVRDLLNKRDPNESDEDEQRRLHAAIEPLIGSLSGSTPATSDKVREVVRGRLEKRYGRRPLP